MTAADQTVAPRGRTLDRVVSWSLYVLQLLASFVAFFLWVTSVMMTDSCGATTTSSPVCNMAYFGAVFIGYAVGVVAAAVITPIAIVVAIRRGRASWPWALGVLLALAAGSVLFVFLMTR